MTLRLIAGGCGRYIDCYGTAVTVPLLRVQRKVRYQALHCTDTPTSMMLSATGAEALRVPACQRLKKFAPFRPGKVRCATVRAAHAPSADEAVSRRQAVQGLALLAASAMAPLQASAAGKSAEVGRQVRTYSDQCIECRVYSSNPSDCLQLFAICRYFWFFKLQARQVQNSSELQTTS